VGGTPFGIDRLVAEPARWLPAGRVALLTNRAALTSAHVPTLDALRAALGERLAVLLSPEHGLSGFGEDATPVPDARDAHSGLSVVSLYGPRRRPDAELLRGVDAVVVDLPDVGVRSYTYAASAALLLEAARREDVEVVVCDRPSLLGPHVDGPALEGFRRSFIAYLDVPFQHGLTLGELLRLHAGRMGGAPLTVVTVDGWRRGTPSAGGGEFVPPSPGLPAPAAVALYPGLVALEGTLLSEGRGTPLPFQLIGGPGVDGRALAGAVAELALPGVWARPLEFRPESGKLAGAVCGGVQLHVSDAGALRPLELGARALRVLHAEGQVAWRACAAMPWAASPAAGEPWFEPVEGLLVDALLGDASFRAVVEGRLSLEEAGAAWYAAHRAFLDDAEAALSYPGRPTSAAEPGGASERRRDGHAPPSRSSGGRAGRTAGGGPGAARLGLGVDAGGSSTRWRLLAPGGAGVGGRLAPLPGHLYTPAGRDGAGALLDDLADAVTAALAQGSVRGAVGAAVAGVSGLDPNGEGGAWLRRELAARLGLGEQVVTVLDDIELAFRGAFPARDGVLVYAGTGAIAVCEGPGGGRVRAGGHGYLLDDEGGGFSIGRAALRALLRAADEAGAAPASTLARRVYARTGGGDWDRVRAYVYGGGRAAVAALAPAVAAAAAEGDGQAAGILGRAGEELARLARVLLARCGEPRPVALAGGVGTIGGVLEARFRSALPADVIVRVAAEEPVDAAARLALVGAAAGDEDGGG